MITSANMETKHLTRPRRGHREEGDGRRAAGRGDPRLLLWTCFFLSGGTSLIFEVAWSKELSYILGNTLLAVSTVVAAFMAGLGLGSAWIARVGERIRRPLRAYALMEIGIAVAGALSIPLFRATTPLMSVLHRSVASGNDLFLLVRFLVVFVLLFLPVVLMGATLPVVVGAAARANRRDSREAGLLYGINTLGAVAGTLAASFALLPAIGIWGTCLVAAGLDLGVAALALGMSRRAGEAEAAVPPGGASRGGSGWTPLQWVVAALFGLSGVAAIGYQVAWFRLLGLTLGPSVYSFAAMLAVYLLGVGAGSALAARWAERTRLGGVGAMCLLEAALGVTGLAGLFYVNELPAMYDALFARVVAPLGPGGLPLSYLILAAALVLVPCLLMGALFPVVVRAIRESGRDLSPEANVGKLYVWNTAGGIAGSLLTGFLLIPRFGVAPTVIGAGLTGIVIAAALAWLRPITGRAPRFALPLALALAGLLQAFAHPGLDISRLNQGRYRDLYTGAAGENADPGQLIYHREGRNAPVAVYRALGKATLHVGGKPDASTGLGDVLTQTLLGHLPVLLAPQAREVAVVGFGCGMTVGAVLANPGVRRVDVLEIEQAVLDAAPYFAAVNGRPLDDPRTRLIVEDGRIHLTYSPATYDVITSEPSNPWMAGVANLFTAEFYATVRQRLRPGGIFAQWVQNYDLSEEAFSVILASLAPSFPHLLVFQTNPWDFIVLASDRPIRVPWSELERRVAEDPVRESLELAGIRDPHALAFFLIGPERQVAQIAARAGARNTDDNAWLEHRAPYEMLRVRPESGAAVGQNRAGELLRAGAAHRVEALAALFPGIALDRAAREMVDWPLRWEPGALGGSVLVDPWADVRRVLVPGLVEELRTAGAAGSPHSFAGALADSVLRWDVEGEARRQVRARLAQRLQAGSPGPEVLAQAAAFAAELPIAAAITGRSRVEAGDLAGAEAAFRMGLHFPESQSCYFALVGLAQVAALGGDLPRSIAWAQIATEQNPYYTNAWLMTADLLRSAGNLPGARAALSEGLRFNPGHERLEAARRQLEGVAEPDTR